MAIAYSGRGGTATKASQSITVNGVASNSLLVAVVEAFKFSYSDSDIVTGVTSGSGAVTWALAKRQRYINPLTQHTTEICIFYKEGAASGNTTAVFTDAGADEYLWNWAEFTGAATTGALDRTAGANLAANGASPLATGSSGTLALADSLAIAGIAGTTMHTWTGPGYGTAFGNVDGGASPNLLGGRMIYHLPGATTALNPSFGFDGSAFQGAVAALATFKGATTTKRIEITGIDTSVNGTTGWTVYYWQTDGVSQTVWRVPGITAEASGGKIHVTSAQAASAGATFPNLADGTNINCVAYRPGATPVKGLVGVLVGTVKDYT